jgi:DNA repair protein RadD
MWPRDGDGEAPSKVCPNCDSILLIAARECPDCGHIFPPPEPKIERTATVEAIMNLTAVEQWQAVADVDYQRHRKAGSPDSLRVTYLVGRTVVSEWVCFEHSGFARQKAVQWWQTWAGTPPPDTVGDALARVGELTAPREAVLERDGKYHRIKRLRKAKVAA